ERDRADAVEPHQPLDGADPEIAVTRLEDRRDVVVRQRLWSSPDALDVLSDLEARVQSPGGPGEDSRQDHHPQSERARRTRHARFLHAGGGAPYRARSVRGSFV